MEQPKNAYRTRTGRKSSIFDAQERVKQAIRSSLRQVWSRFAYEKEQVLFSARKEETRLNKDGTCGRRPTITYKCAHCKSYFKQTEVQVDHIKPVGLTPDTYMEWGPWILALFTTVDNLQVLCKPCHVIKTRDDKSSMRCTLDNAS